MNLFELDENEIIKSRCGDVFLTTKGSIVIQCTLCDRAFKCFEAYVGHLNYKHLNLSEINVDVQEDIPAEEYEISTLIEEEPESLGNDLIPNVELNEESQECAEITVENVDESSTNAEEIKKPFLYSQLEIPNTFRTVKKRILTKQSRTLTEDRKHKCPICGLALKDKYIMQRHFQRHSVEKKHECPDCGVKFHTKTEVKLHMRVHTGERRFLCSDCGSAFPTNYALKNHMKRHKNQRDFKCKLCEKAFFDAPALQNHERAHTLERPFLCKLCPAAFSRKSGLQNHIKLHENKRAYKCNICGKGFNQKPGLLSHIKGAHKTT